MDAYGAAASAASAGASASRLPALKAGQSPMQWFDELGVAAFKFRTPKHRKFVERVRGE